MDVWRVTWSLGEIGALSLKAARGAVLSWGLAEEASWAVRWLGARGLPGAAALARHLREPDGACPLALGAWIADTRTLDHDVSGTLSAPLLLVPFLSRAAREERWVHMRALDFRVTVGPSVVEVDGPVQAAARIDLGWVPPLPAAPVLTARIPWVDDAVLDALSDFAALTYAPSTELSRAKGADAGLVDRD